MPAATSIYETWRDAVADHRPVALATVVEGPGLGSKVLVGDDLDPLGSLGDPDLDRVVIRDALGELESGTTVVRHYGPHGEARETAVGVFIESFAPPPQMLVFGAVDFTGALVRVAKVLGYRVTVCDAREVFATVRRFPDADEVVVDWPHRLLERVGSRLGPRDAICVLTHDHKFDVPAIIAALETDVGYLGAMGSRRTSEERASAPGRRWRRHGRRGPPAPRPDRPRSRWTDAGGDGRGHRRGDHRRAHRPHRAVPAGHRRSHPLIRRSLTGCSEVPNEPSTRTWAN